jgi:hypothetical protein
MFPDIKPGDTVALPVHGLAGSERIAAERKRQIEVEGWTPEHDDLNRGGQLAEAAASYLEAVIWAIPEGAPSRDLLFADWPWQEKWWKPSDDPLRNLEKAGALIAAEIDRLLRQRGQP